MSSSWYSGLRGTETRSLRPFGLMTPILPVMTAETLDSVLCGDQAHPAKVQLSDQDLADLQAYLASLAGGGS